LIVVTVMTFAAEFAVAWSVLWALAWAADVALRRRRGALDTERRRAPEGALF